MTSTEREYDAALRKAFVVGEADYVRVTSRRQQFQLEAIGWAEEKGYLTSRLVEIDDQESHLIARPTAKGRKHWGMGADPKWSKTDIHNAYWKACQDRKGANPAEWPADLRVQQLPEVHHA